MFYTVLHNLKSPENAGIIVRSHVALGGEKIIIIGSEPWRFKKRAQAFSRKLEKLCEFIYLKQDNEFFELCESEDMKPVAIEISSPPTFLPDFKFPDRTALIVGNEGIGLPQNFLNRCHSILTIPQYGQVECLNTAVSYCISMYELMKDKTGRNKISGHKYLISKNNQVVSNNQFSRKAGTDGNSQISEK